MQCDRPGLAASVAAVPDHPKPRRPALGVNIARRLPSLPSVTACARPASLPFRKLADLLDGL